MNTQLNTRFSRLILSVALICGLVGMVSPLPASAAPSVVQVTGTQGNWQLTVNGSPYYVKGLDYGPTISSSTADAYLADLQAMGVNTTRTWGTDNTTQPLLTAANAHGIKVVMGFWLNQNVDYVGNTQYKNNTLNSIVGWVNTYKNDPGVLMWDVGNEVILFLQNYFSGSQLEAERVAYAQYVNQVVNAIHAADPNHPVTSTDAWTGAWPYYKAYTPSLDLMAVNSYGAICSVKNDWIAGNYTKPYIVTEWGPSGEWEVPNDANGVPLEPTDSQKSAGYTSAWGCITGHTGVALGGTGFIYGDKEDFGGVWFNVKHTGNLNRPAYYALKQAFTGQPITGNTPPVFQSMTLSQTANIKAGTKITVTANFSDPNGDALTYSLRVCQKYINGNTIFSTPTFTQTGPGTFLLTTSKSAIGVWKLYVYAYDGHGNIGIGTATFGTVR